MSSTHPRVLGLEWAENGLQECFGKQGCLGTSGCHASGDVEPVTEFRVGYDSLWSSVDLHGKTRGPGQGS